MSVYSSHLLAGYNQKKSMISLIVIYIHIYTHSSNLMLEHPFISQTHAESQGPTIHPLCCFRFLVRYCLGDENRRRTHIFSTFFFTKLKQLPDPVRPCDSHLS